MVGLARRNCRSSEDVGLLHNNFSSSHQPREMGKPQRDQMRKGDASVSELYCTPRPQPRHAVVRPGCKGG
uniref:Uncharacterized protein n=1 Tax=Arundo donax TaxID=35708 RepID=A0A0A9E566_ARUDO